MSRTIKSLAIATTIISGLLSSTASASSVFDGLRDIAPRSVFDDIRTSAPRSLFDDIRDTAPRSKSIFDTIKGNAP